nr:hypothetical protein HK105_006940 [Polyrhizophydium stewartii]
MLGETAPPPQGDPNNLSRTYVLLKVAQQIKAAADSAAANRAAAEQLARHAVAAAGSLVAATSGSGNETAKREGLRVLGAVLDKVEALLKKTAERSVLQQLLLLHPTAGHIKELEDELSNNLRDLGLAVTVPLVVDQAIQLDSANLTPLFLPLMDKADNKFEVVSERLETLLAIEQNRDEVVALLPANMRERLRSLLDATAADIVAFTGRTLSARQAWTVYPSDVYIVRSRQLGSGGFGEVFRARWNGRAVAVKTLGRRHDAEADRALQQEAALWHPLRHENVLSLHGVCIDADEPFIVMPMMLDSVAAFLGRFPTVGGDVRAGFISGIASGMKYLHGQNVPIIHGDLKADNVLIDNEYRVCIADFGMAFAKVQSQADPRRRGAAVRWIAPERFKRGYKLAQPYDVFSFAMTAIEVMTGALPFADVVDDAAVSALIKRGSRPQRPSGMSDAMWDIVVACWNKDPSARPTFAGVVEKLSSVPAAVLDRDSVQSMTNVALEIQAERIAASVQAILARSSNLGDDGPAIQALAHNITAAAKALLPRVRDAEDDIDIRDVDAIESLAKEAADLAASASSTSVGPHAVERNKTAVQIAELSRREPQHGYGTQAPPSLPTVTTELPSKTQESVTVQLPGPAKPLEDAPGSDQKRKRRTDQGQPTLDSPVVEQASEVEEEDDDDDFGITLMDGKPVVESVSMGNAGDDDLVEYDTEIISENDEGAGKTSPQVPAGGEGGGGVSGGVAQDSSMAALATIAVARNQIEVLKSQPLGKGGYGEVYRGRFDASTVAVKLIRAKHQSALLPMLRKEVLAWYPLRHRNIVPLMRVCLDTEWPLLLMPLMREDARDFVCKRPDLSVESRTWMLGQIARGMAYMHQSTPPVIHGDLKANNVLIGTVCITDFGMSFVKTSPTADTVRRTHALRWVAPEAHDVGYKLDLPSDVFAFAMTAVEILTGELPFAEESSDEIVKEWVLDGERPYQPKGTPESLWQILDDAWHHDPAKRPEFSKIVEMLDALPSTPISVSGEAAHSKAHFVVTLVGEAEAAKLCFATQPARMMYTRLGLRLTVWTYVATVLATVYNSRPLSLFSAHPVCMSLFLAVGAEALLSFEPVILRKRDGGQKRAPRMSQVDRHRGLMSLGLVFLLAGFAAIYYAKEEKNRPHFSTTHGKYGVVLVGWGIAQMVAGGVFHNFNFPRTLLKIHGIGGIAMLVLTGWFTYFTQIDRVKGWFTMASMNIPYAQLVPFSVIAKYSLGAATVLLALNYMNNRQGRA